MARETGQALDKVGLKVLNKPVFKESFSRHRAVMNLYEHHPDVSVDAFVAPNASVVGNVFIGMRASVWYGAVLRGDMNHIQIAPFASVGDRAVIHTSKSVEGKPAAVVKIGSHAVIGPGALIQSAIIENHAVVGAGAIIMEGAVVEEYARVAEGAVVHPGRRVPKGQLWGGNPAVFVRNLTKTEMAHHAVDAEAGADLAAEHKAEFLPANTAYLQAEALGVPAASLPEARDLSPTQVEVEGLIRPAAGLHPPKDKDWADMTTAQR
ncbi:GAMMACA1 [Symbiodinium sp. KB8]|nr:GAMMACA1 [Symbiodinium sp. KB8]